MGTQPEPTSEAGPTTGAAARARSSVAASILGVLLLGGYFVRSGDAAGFPRLFLLDAGVLVAAFWFPAMRVGTVRDVGRQWVSLTVWFAAWTLVWDLASSGLFGREPFQEWWLVYPGGIAFFLALLVLHGAVADRAGARWRRGRGRGT